MTLIYDINYFFKMNSFIYHKDLEKQEILRDCSVLVTVTRLWHVAQWVSRAPPHHTLPAFLNLNGIYSLIKSNQFLSNSAFPLSYRKSISWLSSFKICKEICFLALSSCVFLEESSSPRNNSQLIVSQTDFRILSAWFDSLT